MLESLSKEEKERLFNNHINQLVQRKRDQFRKLLDEQTEVNISEDDFNQIIQFGCEVYCMVLGKGRTVIGQ